MCKHPSSVAGRRRAVLSRERLSDLARLRRVRDRIDREYARPLDVEALARRVDMAAGRLSREFRLAYGVAPYTYVEMRRVEPATESDPSPVRNREAPGHAE